VASGRQTGYRYKTARPRVKGTFRRERLFKLLKRHLSSPVVWISGPAGSGKTCLLSSYLDRRHIPSIWYQADETDSDTGTFFHHLRSGIITLFSDTEIPLPAFGAEYHGNIKRYARIFFDTLFSAVPSPFLMVIDNYQDIPPDSHLHEVMEVAMEMLPEGRNIIVISREQIPKQSDKR